MSLPKTADEFMARFAANQKVTGRLLETAMHAPCPFCGAADFAIWVPFEMATKGYQATMGKETTCSECGRSGLTIVSESTGVTFAEFVQTAGDPPPAYIVPAPRYCAELHNG